MKHAHLLLLTSLLLAPALTGCTNASAGATSSGLLSMSPAQLNEIRQEMDQIPPPTKARYLAVKTLTSWENPYLTVQGRMVTLHVTLADANTSDLGQGGLLRPVGARQQELNVRTSDLAAAMNAIPQNAWPYGRVVAVEEAHNIPTAARPEVRRNMEATLKNLTDIGVVAYEWQEGGAGLK